MSVAQSILGFGGSIDALSPSERAALLDRSTSSDVAVRRATESIIAEVRSGGDTALLALARRFDAVDLETIEVPRARWTRALDALDPGVRRAMERAAANIAAVHEANRPEATRVEPEPGVVIVRRPDPLARVGVYAPGGRAAYPSSVLMAAVPARVAGVAEVIVCSPPDASGGPSPLVLAAAQIARADRVFAIGGAGAVAAMALGTESVPRVDRIVGPGNAYVAEAKLQLCGSVGIDSPAGPSELLVICDAAADPAVVAIELVAQAEHDPLARVVAVVVGDEDAADRVRVAVAAAADGQPRRDIIAAALSSGGGVLSARDEAQAVAFANEYAPEHLLVVAQRTDSIVAGLRNAGTVFVGASTSVAFGDYMTGANHVLPTGGLARSYSGLSTSDFVRWTTIQTVTPEAAGALAADVAVFAEAEGLPGHAAAARRSGAIT